jgi:hypothetical protein
MFPPLFHQGTKRLHALSCLFAAGVCLILVLVASPPELSTLFSPSSASSSSSSSGKMQPVMDQSALNNREARQAFIQFGVEDGTKGGKGGSSSSSSAEGRSKESIPTWFRAVLVYPILIMLLGVAPVTLDNMQVCLISESPMFV